MDDDLLLFRRPYTKSEDGERLAMLVLNDEKGREYAYGPALGLPDSKVGTFTPAL